MLRNNLKHFEARRKKHLLNYENTNTCLVVLYMIKYKILFERKLSSLRKLMLRNLFIQGEESQKIGIFEDKKYLEI